MPMSIATAWRQLAKLLIVIAVILLAVGLIDSALAQGEPFGGLRPQNAPIPVGGFARWLLAKQAEFYRQFSGLIRAAKADGSAAWSLFGLAFLYGIFHAAGPGHGKAVISSYLVANEETWRRGVVLSFASALLQAITAVVIVGVAAVLIGATAKMMGDTVRVIELVSYALIVLVGARLLWVKGRAFVHTLRTMRAEHAPAAADHPHDHGHCADHHHAHEHQTADAHDHGRHHAHEHEHDHDDEASVLPWGHAHGPEPEELA